MKTNDKLTLELADIYSTVIKKKPEVIAEGANDHESEHKTILKKLHKEYPHLGLDKAEHTQKYKHTSNDGETHTYHSEEHTSNNDIHNHLLPHLKTKVVITHNGENVVGGVRHEWGEKDNRRMADHSEFHYKNGKLTVRHTGTGVTKEL